MIPNDFQPTRLTYTLFFPPQDFGDKITLSSRLRDAAEGAFDGEPLILPVAPNVQPDVPRIQLTSRDQTLALQLGLQRLTLDWNRRGSEPAPWEGVWARFSRVASGVNRVFIGEYAKPTRFSLVPTFFYRMAQSANEYLASRVMHPDRVLGKPASFKVGLHDLLEINGRRMNLWMNLSSARNQQNMAEDNGVVAQFDFNSAAEDPRPAGPDEIAATLGEAEALMERRLVAFFNDIFWASA